MKSFTGHLRQHTLVTPTATSWHLSCLRSHARMQLCAGHLARRFHHLANVLLLRTSGLGHSSGALTSLSSWANEQTEGQLRRRCFFMLENVMGITHRHQASQTSSLDTLMGNIQRQLGKEWAIQPIVVNALDFGLPQSRKRVYLVGRNLRYYCRGQPAPPPAFRSRVAAGQLLDRSDTMRRFYTELQMWCLNAWKSKYKAYMEDRAMKGQFAFVEVNRDPTERTAWRGSSLNVDTCECLRAAGPMLHVFALGEGTGQLSLDRPLRMRERAALQGFPDSVGHFPFNETAGKRILGNAMAVPVIGSLLAQELRFLLGTLPFNILAAACSGGQSDAQAPALCGPARTTQFTSPSRQLGQLLHISHGHPGLRTDPCSSHPGQQDSQAGGSDAELPGLRSACVAWAASIRAHWASGQPGRAPKPRAVLGPADDLALERRSAKRRQLSISTQHASDADVDARGLGENSHEPRGQPLPAHMQEASVHTQDSSDSDAPMTSCIRALTPRRSPTASSLEPLQQQRVLHDPDSVSDSPLASFHRPRCSSRQ